MSEIGVVVIGRNEGERLVRCLQSLPEGIDTVYVDSGSTDNSVTAAKAHGARVVELDMATPFTAARARNAGRAVLPAGCNFIQFVDGDCAVQPGWIEEARRHLESDPGLAAVFGRRREIHPEASRYNWMCDLEWAVAPGEVRYCGGDVMIRAAALDEAGGYPGEMIAGEEPDLSIRMRGRGWTIRCIDREMTLHDAAITRFGQWWKRTVRSGHAYAELADRHRGSSLQDYDRRLRKVLVWGLLLPFAFLASLVFGLVGNGFWLLIAAALFLLPLAQIARLTMRERKRHGWRKGAWLALFLTLAKPSQAMGWLRYRTGRLRGRRAALIEYKGDAR